MHDSGFVRQVDDQTTLQALTHGSLCYSLKLIRIPATDLVAEDLSFKVFALGVMEDRGDRFVAGVGGAVAADFYRVRSGSLVTRDGLPAAPYYEFILFLLED